MTGPPPPVPSSPCQKTCRLDGRTGLCEGCGRTGDEIAAWSALGEPARQAIMRDLPGRMARAFGPAAGASP